MALTKSEVNHLVGYLTAWYHATRRPVPKGLDPYSGTVGTVKRSMIRVYQKAHALPITGEFDTATQKSLAPVDPRKAMVAHGMNYITWATGHHNSFIYSQNRPGDHPPMLKLWELPRGGRYRDCSLFGKDAAKAAGFPDSAVDQYAHSTGWGNTDSILAHANATGKVKPINVLRQMDFVIFTNPGHLVVVTGPHATDPQGSRWVASDGHQGAPELVTLQQEINSHPGPYYGIAVG